MTNAQCCRSPNVAGVLPMSGTVSIVAEIPEELHEALKDYLEVHPDWDLNRVFAASLSLFLLQNGESDRRVSRVYLSALFRQPA